MSAAITGTTHRGTRGGRGHRCGRHSLDGRPITLDAGRGRVDTGCTRREEGGSGEAEQPIEFYLASADVAKGADVFKKCQACHTVDQGGANGLGPNL